VFDKFPVNEWLRSGERSRIRWASQVSPARLSNHQRLMVKMGIRLDGAELADRPGKGRMLMLVQVSDAQGRLWQDHGTIDFDKVKEGVRSEYLDYTWSAFLLPGDYRVAFAVADTLNRDHGVREERLHVAPLKSDPLPDAWRGLPPVEFLSPADPPDSWYLPSIGGPLHLPLQTRRPVRIEVLVNLTPSERATGSVAAQSGNLSVLLPALKAISQLELHNASLRVAMLDLLHRQVVFHQDDGRGLDWSAVRSSLSRQQTGTIDVKSLEDRSRIAAFFVSEVGRRVGPIGGGPARALVVLSSSVEFERGEDLQPIEAAPSPDCRVFYLRFPAALPRRERRAGASPGFPGHGHMGHGNGEWQREERGEQLQIDQLERTLKPLGPRLFDIESPEVFRKALAAVLAEISAM
jgi:hypothetical protein